MPDPTVVSVTDYLNGIETDKLTATHELWTRKAGVSLVIHGGHSTKKYCPYRVVTFVGSNNTLHAYVRNAPTEVSWVWERVDGVPTPTGQEVIEKLKEQAGC